MTTNLTGLISATKVSSVLDDNAAQFGKTFLFDGQLHTAWNSDKGSVQWITVKFGNPVFLSRLSLSFQGGFSSRRVTVSAGGPLPGSTKLLLKPAGVYAGVDTNSAQSFSLATSGIAGAADAAAPRLPVTVLKVAFEDFTDFFGRVIVYDLSVFGEVAVDLPATLDAAPSADAPAAVTPDAGSDTHATEPSASAPAPAEPGA